MLRSRCLHIHQGLTGANLSAFLYWWGSTTPSENGDNEGLLEINGSSVIPAGRLHPGHRPAAGQRFSRQPLAAPAAVRRFLAVQEPEQRPVPGRVRRRQQRRPAAGPVALQERTWNQPRLQPALTG